MRFKRLRITDKPIGRILVDLGIIDEDKLEIALTIHKEKNGSSLLGTILLELNFVDEHNILKAVTTQYKFPYLPADRYDIKKEVINLIPADIVNKYTLVPIERMGNCLTVAMSNPLNNQAVEELEKTSHCVIQIVISSHAEITRTIHKYYNQEPLFSLLPRSYS